MLNKRFKKILATVLIISLNLSGIGSAFATSPVQKKKEIEALQKQLEATEKEIVAIEEELVSLKGRLQGLSAEIESEEKKVAELDFEIKERTKVFEKRLKQLYLRDREFGLLLLLNSEGFWDLINRIRFLTFLSKADVENLRELNNAKKERKQLLMLLKQNKEKLRLYVSTYEQKKIQLLQLKSSLQAALARAKTEYRLLLTPSGLKKYASRGYIARGGGYKPWENVPKKFVKVMPYEEAFLTSERMPSEYEASGKKWVCYASWYGNEFHGRRTASGEIFNQWDFTVAHRSLPFGTFVLIRRGSRAIVAKVTDRGPFIPGREFDLSRACAEALGFSGVARIEVEIIFPR